MASTRYGNEFDAEEEDIARRTRYAELLRDQATTALPVNQMAGRVAVPLSWTQGLAQVLKGGMGGYLSQKASEDRKALAGRKNQALAEALGGMPRAQQVAQPTDQEGTGSFDMSGMAGPATQMQSPTMQQNAQWLAQLGKIGPNAVQMGSGLLGMQQRGDEMEANRQARMQDRVMQLEAAAQNAAASREERAARAAESAALRREMQASQQAFAAQQAQAQREFMVANRPPRPDPAITPVTVMQNGKPVVVDGRTGKVIGNAPAPGQGRPMTATAQKELIETDEQIQASDATVKLLEQAKAINYKAMGFTGAGAVASMGTLLPESMRPETVDATQNLDNILQSAALPQLKAIFGGMPTEGERKILLDVQGSSSKPPKVRAEIFKRAEEAVKARQKFAKEKAAKLRSGEYFSDQGGGGGAPGQPRVVDW